jgi:hypothetical protein
MRLIHDDLARTDRALSLQRLVRRQQGLRDIAAVRASQRAERAVRRTIERAVRQAGVPGHPVHACSDSE